MTKTTQTQQTPHFRKTSKFREFWIAEIEDGIPRWGAVVFGYMFLDVFFFQGTLSLIPFRLLGWL